ncbi:MAG: CsbD family protein [Chloroflexi bacterium]|nr:CsbD family protein [Chloroflexota bacterium]MBP8058485.1 CsbD family protein [Chloroflexota bacterium]
MTTLTSRFNNNGYIYSGKWHRAKGSARRAWGRVTGNEVARLAGQQEYMLGVLQEKYGYTRKDAHRALSQLLATYDEKKTDLVNTFDEKKQEMKNVLQLAKDWVDEKRGVKPKASRIAPIAGLAAATTVAALMAYYLGWFRMGPASTQS